MHAGRRPLIHMNSPATAYAPRPEPLCTLKHRFFRLPSLQVGQEQPLHAGLFVAPPQSPAVAALPPLRSPFEAPENMSFLLAALPDWPASLSPEPSFPGVVPPPYHQTPAPYHASDDWTESDLESCAGGRGAGATSPPPAAIEAAKYALQQAGLAPLKEVEEEVEGKPGAGKAGSVSSSQTQGKGSGKGPGKGQGDGGGSGPRAAPGSGQVQGRVLQAKGSQQEGCQKAAQARASSTPGSTPLAAPASRGSGCEKSVGSVGSVGGGKAKRGGSAAGAGAAAAAAGGGSRKALGVNAAAPSVAATLAPAAAAMAAAGATAAAPLGGKENRAVAPGQQQQEASRAAAAQKICEAVGREARSRARARAGPEPVPRESSARESASKESAARQPASTLPKVGGCRGGKDGGRARDGERSSVICCTWVGVGWRLRARGAGRLGWLSRVSACTVRC